MQTLPLRRAFLFSLASSFVYAQLTVTPSPVTLCPGESVTFSSSSSGKTTWVISPTVTGITLESDKSKVTVAKTTTVPQSLIITGTSEDGMETGAAELFVSKDACFTDNEARAVIGFEQAGASSTEAEQKFFFDFFIDRELKNKWVSLWGNVRVSSYPQQISTPLAQFDIATQVGQLPVNKLAETASFLTGLDFHPSGFTFPVRSGRRRIGFIVSVGATGPFTPTNRVALFAVPDSASPQYVPFITRFPQAKGSTYVGFVPPDRNQFYRQYSGGVRVTTMYHEHGGFTVPAATYTATIGQDEAVTHGHLQGAVLKFDVFYPLPMKIKNYRFLYLFGTSAMQVERPHDQVPFILKQAPSTITGSEASVAIISAPSSRDSYRIGVGLDAVGVLCEIFKCGQ